VSAAIEGLAVTLQELADERFEEMREARAAGEKERVAELRGEVLGLLTAVNIVRFEVRATTNETRGES